MATTTTVEAYRASPNHSCHQIQGAPPLLVRFGSVVVACPPASVAWPPLDPGGALPLVARLGAAPPLAPGATRTLEGTAIAAKTLSLAAWGCFYSRPNLVRLNQMAPLDQVFL